MVKGAFEVNRAQHNKNYIFRWFECGLSIEETAKLCFKSVMTVTKWDAGRTIPRECRLLMQLATGQRLTPLDETWRGWQLAGPYLISPEGVKYTARRITALQFAVTTEKPIKPEISKLIRQRLNRVSA